MRTDVIEIAPWCVYGVMVNSCEVRAAVCSAPVERHECRAGIVCAMGAKEARAIAPMSSAKQGKVERARSMPWRMSLYEKANAHAALSHVAPQLARTRRGNVKYRWM